jgi:RHS repeat-associated protein
LLPTTRRSGTTGEQRDSESGYDYLRARYYDPEVGRFLGQDPVSQGANLYSYTASNPVNFTDPSGKAIWVEPWEDASYADTWMFFMAQLQVEANYLEEDLYYYFEGSGALGVLLIHGPLERCYDEFTSCSARNGVRVQWLPEPDPFAVIDISTCLNPDCTQVWYCQAATSGCVSQGGNQAQGTCQDYYCCPWGSECATKLPNVPWECGVGILQVALGIAGLATTPTTGGWGIAFGLTNLAIGSGVTYASCT